MKSLPLKTIIKEIRGKTLHGTDDFMIHNCTTKIKMLEQGTLLFDLDHDQYADIDIYPKNCSCAIVTDDPAKFTKIRKNITVIQVARIRRAFWRFIEFYRSLFEIPVIGVTGTCGKTSTKEMIKYILSENNKVNATYKSYNALSHNLEYLLDIDDHTQMAVYEMGVAYPGDLSVSCRFFRPQVGVITNIGIDHLQAFGTLDAYIEGKAEFLKGLNYKGTLILNADDENIKKIDLSNYKGTVVYFGFDDKADFKISDLQQLEQAWKFTLQHKHQIYNFTIPGHGKFNVYNATAAIAAAHAAGIDINDAGKRLATFQNVEKHFEFNKGIHGSTIIDDTWSTNPTSAEAALQLLKQLFPTKKTVAILGKMSLLGKHSKEYHYKTGKKVADIGISQLIALGDSAKEIGLGALHNGMNQDSVYFCKDSDETYEVLKKILDENTVVLIKTSMLASYSDLMDKIITKK